MKILVIHCAYKQKGGEDTVVSEEINLLRANGATVELLKFTNEGNSFMKLLQLPFNVKSYVQTRRKLRTYKADVVHIHNLHYGGSLSIVYAIKKSGIPAVITLHNFRLLCPSGTLFQKGQLYLDSLRKSFPWKAIWHGAYRNSVVLTFWVSLSVQLHTWLGTWKIIAKYITLSEHARGIFLHSKLQLKDEQVTVKPNFCSAPAFVGQHTGGYFLYVGRLSEEKGIILMLNAFAANGYPIKIAGDGPLVEHVKAYSAKYANIEFLHFQDKNAVVNLMSNCTALIFPSIWYEGMPLTIIEAFSSSTPVIASRLGVMEDMISNEYNGLHFEAGDEHDLTAKLKIWYDMKEEEKGIYRKNANQTYDQHYTMEKNYEQLMSIYKGVIKEKKGTVSTVFRPARHRNPMISRVPGRID